MLSAIDCLVLYLQVTRFPDQKQSPGIEKWVGGGGKKSCARIPGLWEKLHLKIKTYKYKLKPFKNLGNTRIQCDDTDTTDRILVAIMIAPVREEQEHTAHSDKVMEPDDQIRQRFAKLVIE